MDNTHKKTDLPLFMDYAVEVPAETIIEQSASQDCITWGEAGCDDD